MSKVALAADIHFGVPGRLNDIELACRAIREYCNKNSIDTVVVLGDMFHDRRALEIDVLVAASRFFEDTVKDYEQTWITFPGNHDMFLRHSWDINSLIPLRKHVELINDVNILKLDNQRFWVVPFIQYEKSYMRVIKRIEKEVEDGDKILTHIGVRGASLNTCFLLKDWSIVDFENTPFDRIYTGHFHSSQQVNDKVWYPGSPIPFKFDEGDVEHGFYVYDTETNEHEFINIWNTIGSFFPDETPPPQFCTIDEEQLDQLDQSDVNNNIIRVALSNDRSVDEKKLIKNRLKSMGAKTVRWMNLNQRVEECHEKSPGHAENRNLFSAWLDADKKGTKDLDKDVLVQINDEVILEGDELYTIEESESW